jgi:small subunit ribosomal protein S2
VAQVGIRELLEAGVHFGHQTRRWNPKMRRFIFGERGGIYIIDLLKTADNLERAQEFAAGVSRRGGTVLFVGTKKQARDGIKDVAEAAGMPYVNHRWLGGLLTNFQTISLRIKRLHDLERYETEGQLQLLPTRERLSAQADLEKLRANLGGVKNMQRPPDAVFVIDLKTEAIAVREAQRLRIPIIGLVDTNCDPDGIDYVVPGNDDAIRACNVITQAIGDVVAEGRGRFREEEEQARREAEEQARREAEERERREAEEQARREAEEFQRAEAERALTEGGEGMGRQEAEQVVADAVRELGPREPEGHTAIEATAAEEAAEEIAAPATSAVGPTASPERPNAERAAPQIDDTTPGENVKPARRRRKKAEEDAPAAAAAAEPAVEEAAAAPAPAEEAAPAPAEEAAPAPAEEAAPAPAEEAAPAPAEEAAPAPAEEAAPAPAEETAPATAEEASQDTEQTQETESK